jgi:YVTN family beta-propeller protein
VRPIVLALCSLVLVTACSKSNEGPAPFTVTCELAAPNPEALRSAGPHPDGGYVLIGGRLITPAGDMVPLGGFPMAFLPLGDRYLAVTDGAKDDETLRIFDLETRTVVATDSLSGREGAFYYGLEFDGQKLFVAGGGGAEGNMGENFVYVYDVDAATGALSARRSIAMRGYPAGLSFTPDKSVLVAALLRDNALNLIDPATETLTSTIKLTGSPEGKFGFPYAVVTTTGASGHTVAYASLWGAADVAVVDLVTQEVGYIEVGKNPEGLLLLSGDRLLVANSDSDSVSVIDLATQQVTVTQTLGESADAPRGISPSALTLTPDGSRVLVTLTGDNAVDVLDAQTLARVGRIPTGWYPTAALWHATRDEVLILNAKGVGAGPNVIEGNNTDWIDNMDLMQGTISIVPPPDDDALATGTATVTANNGRPQAVAPTLTCTGAERRFPLPEKPGDPTPIEHVVLIIRENKTYDAILGDLEGANGRPELALWGEEVTPNLHALARQFTILDNFYSNAEESLQGHQWTAADNSNDFSEKNWLTTWGRSTHPISDFATAATTPEKGYVWQQLERAGVDYVDMGEVIGVDSNTNIDTSYPGLVFNLSVLDVDKADYFASKLQREGLPRFTYIGLPNDHTSGTTPGQPTPESMIADNDEATGRIIAALSASPLWEKTVVFVIEDDPQDGADHVEAHRSPCLVVGPWVKHGYVSSQHYDNPSLWRTITLLLGVPPLSRYDATAAAMFDVFGAAPDLAPYTTIPRTVPVQMNPENAFGAEASKRMDFSSPDAAKGLQELLWRYRMKTEPPWVKRPRVDRGDD